MATYWVLRSDAGKSLYVIGFRPGNLDADPPVPHAVTVGPLWDALRFGSEEEARRWEAGFCCGCPHRFKPIDTYEAAARDGHFKGCLT